VHVEAVTIWSRAVVSQEEAADVEIFHPDRVLSSLVYAFLRVLAIMTVGANVMLRINL